jgi:SAM-dependent methyltransferase
LRSGKNKRKKWRPAELEDQTWFPNWLRAYQMAFLSSLDRITQLYLPVNKLLENIDSKRIVDLASGSGESAMNTTAELRKSGTKVLLTDKFPSERRAKGESHLIEKVDVLESELPDADLYIMFNAFHHFDSEERELIAKKASHNKGQFLIIEPLRPRVDVFFKVFLATFIGPFLLAPFMRPFSFKWLLLTYAFPLGVLATCWDGLASVVKSLSQEEWDDLETELTSSGRIVEQGLLPSRMAKLKYFLVK